MLDAATGAGGIKLNQASATTPDFTIAVSGAIAADGRVSGFHLHGATPDLANLMANFPQNWRMPAEPWHGSAKLTASGEGPPGALNLQLRAETGDLVVEADQHRDTVSGVADTTLTMRHPGAPYLLETLGYSGTGAWLGAGSMALLAHLHSSPGFASLGDVAFDAADMHLRGHGTVFYAGATPSISLDLHADQLALPTLDQLQTTGMPFLALPPGWQARVQLSASHVEIGLRPAAENLSAELTAAQNNFFADLRHAAVAGGTLAAQAAADATQKPMLAALRADLSRAGIPGAMTGWPIEITSGNADLDLDLTSSANDWPSMRARLSGDAHLALRDATLSGLSLPHLDRALAGHPPPTRATLLDALTNGDTSGLSGAADIAIDHGQASIANAGLSSIEGSLSVTGGFGLADRKLDLAIGITPATQESSAVSIKLTGAGTNVKSSIDLGKFTPAARKPARRPNHRT
jgi:hypothetical protein